MKTRTGEAPSQCSGAPISAGTISGSEKASDVALGIEEVAVEELRGRARELVRDPREDPLVQLGVGVVVARQRRGTVASGQVWTMASSRQRPAIARVPWRNRNMGIAGL